MACCLFVSKSLTEARLTCCQLDTEIKTECKIQYKLNQNIMISFQENTFEKVLWGLFKPLCVETMRLEVLLVCGILRS